MRCTLWIRLLYNVATLQPVSLGGGTGGHSSHRGPCPPGHPLEPPLNLKLFTMSCQRRILRIRWFDHVTNVDVISQAGREDLATVISSDDVWRSLNMFVDYWRRQQVGWHCGWLLTWPDNNPCWKRQRRHNWLGQSDVDDSWTLPPIAVNEAGLAWLMMIRYDTIKEFNRRGSLLPYG